MRIANAESRPRRHGDFVETETARDIRRSFDLVRTFKGSALTVISGAEGTGKTHCLRQACADDGYDAIYLTIASNEGKPFSVAEKLLMRFKTKAAGKSLVECSSILRDYVGRGRVLVLDDAHFLEQGGAEWVQALAEEAGFDLVLCGNLGLASLVNRVAQVQARMVRPVVIREVSRNDVAAIVACGAFDHTQGIDRLHAVAALTGGLKKVDAVLQQAGIFAAPGAPDMSHLEAAIAYLKLAPKG